MYIVLFIRNEEDYLSTDYFIEELQISRTTIFSDIKEFKQILQYHAIELKNNRRYGYYLSGEETAIRNALLFFFTSILTGKQNTTIFDLIIKKNKLKPFDESKKIIEEVSNRNKCFFVEKRLDEFVYIFVFLLTRIQRTEARIVNNNSLDAMTTFKEYKFTVDIIEAFGIEQRFSQQELFYVTSWTLSISFGSVDVSTKDFNLISNFVYKVMDRFNLLSGYQYDFTDGFFNQLYVHMRPAYYRLLFNIPVINSLTDRVKQEFNSLFHLVQETMKPFVSSFGQEVPESEIAYLTMHFANIIRKKEDVTTEVPSHKTANALIVCSNGIGSSAILYNELSELFPDLNFYRPVSIVKMSEFGSKVDIIFSTDHLADLYDDQIPVIRVHPIISMEERYQLLHEVNMKLNRKQNINIDKIMEVIDKHSNILNASQLRHDLTSLLMDDSSFEKPSMEVHEQETRKLKLTDLFDIELLQLSVEANNWEDAVRKSYDPLIKKSIISEKYMEKTIRGVQLKGYRIL
ncbi:PRD domain-containing protein [Enterococcus gallinarum]|nr:PRD domain-containing protein [Enterococcus gallinarum]